MPFICIGPVCIPWTCLPAVVFFIWKFAKPLFPKATAEAIEEWGRKVSAICQPYVDKVYAACGMKKKKAKAVASGDIAAFDAAKPAFEVGSVTALASEDHLDELLKRSKAEDFTIVLDFTAVWCKPCQAIKPKFKELASEFPKHCFVTVDADDLEDVHTRCEVMALPTFQVWKGGEKAGSLTGGKDPAGLEKFVKEHVVAAEAKKGQ